MKILRGHYLLMDKQQEGGSGGAGGTTGDGSLLTNNSGGSGSTQSSGGQNSSSNTNSAQSTNAGNTNAGAGGGQAQDWRSSLPSELREDPAIKMFNDVGALAKSYVHAQKLVGADKIAIPGKHATEDDWKQVFSKLGVPEKIDDYAIKFKEGVSLDKKFVDGFRENAYKAGVLPAQAQKLADWFTEVNQGAEKDLKTQTEARQKTELDALKNEWGQAFQQNLNRAAQVIREVGNPELIEYLDKSGLGNDTKLIKLLAGVANKFMKEDTLVGADNALKPKFTPEEALKETRTIMGDPSHPYNNADHPNHKTAVKEVQDLYEAAYPSKK